jgi:hypothetical protein
MRAVEIEDLELKQVSKIVLNDGTEIDFTDDLLGYALLSGDEVTRLMPDSSNQSYNLLEIEKLYTEGFDLGRTLVLSLVIVPFGIFALAILLGPNISFVD